MRDSLKNRDASLVACTDPQELKQIKNNFLIAKLGFKDNSRLNEVLEEVCHIMGQSNRNKSRIEFYYLFTVILHKENVFL